MTPLFGALFLASEVALSAAYVTGDSVAVGSLAVDLSGLLTANGLLLPYWSTTLDAT